LALPLGGALGAGVVWLPWPVVLRGTVVVPPEGA
jgi:hypothetical protein